MQRVLKTAIGDLQQGFAHGRQMLETVMMIMTILAAATAEPELAAKMSRGSSNLTFGKRTIQ